MVSDDFRGALFILAGMLIFSVQDVLIRQLSDGGSLLQVLTMRGVLGALVISIFVRLTGAPTSRYIMVITRKGITGKPKANQR